MKIGLIEPCNFVDYPTGGQLTFAKQLITAFGNNLIIIGISTDKYGIGKWGKKIINGIEYDFFPYMYLPNSSKKPFIPLRIKNYIALRKYKNAINTKNISNIFTQSPDSLLAISSFGFPNICYYFAGTENPLSISRYKIGNYIAFLYDRYFLPKLLKINLILAAADDNAIYDLIKRSKGLLNKEKVVQFPTRIDTNIYKKLDNIYCKNLLKIPQSKLLIVTTGRLGWFKGWKFMIDCFKTFQSVHENAILYFIGNGEDYEKITKYISLLGLNSSVYLVGFKDSNAIATYLNAADLFIMGSYKEGWSTSLIEAVACGAPACVTNFSSAKEIIENGITGYVSEYHNEIEFVKNMENSLLIDRNNLPLKRDIEKYSIANLKQDLLEVWPLI